MTHQAVWRIGSATNARPPRVPGLPFLGNALALRGDMARFLVDNYHRYGAAYRIRILSREYTVLAGIEANQLLAKAGNELLTGERAFHGFAAEMGDGAFLPAMEGEPHRHLRRILRPGYAKEALVPHMDRLIAITHEHIERWRQQERVQVVPAMQHLITDQLGIILGGRAVGEYFTYVRDFMRIVIAVTMLGTQPKSALKSKRYLTARAKTREFLLDLIREHQANPGSGDLIDIAVQARDLDGDLYDENDQVIIAVGAYVAGMDTLANTVSFMLYAMLKHPEVFDAVRADADAVFTDGTPTLHQIRAQPALHGAAIETLRMYMIAPLTIRTAIRDFEFAGYGIPAGTDVMIANGVTHFLPEFFPDPYTFKIDRDLKRVPNSFTPFTLGAHTCLGAGVAESLLMLTPAVIAHKANLQLDPPGYTATIQSTPAPNPGAKFHMRVSER